MIKEQIWIEKPIEEVWAFVEKEFAKAFKCSPSKLTEATTTVKTKSFTGSEVVLNQSVTQLVRLEKITIQSVNGDDCVSSGYEFEADGETGTFLSLFETGTNLSKKSKSLNYTIMSLPILNRGSKKRLRRRLESIKSLLESTGEQNDSSSISS